jgi:UDP-N-acetylglucosamine--N-acetylmuramyl-(pentapeptide) pyrophosphoryl-undecaprenol N-acetylglucosamine transferase
MPTADVTSMTADAGHPPATPPVRSDNGERRLRICLAASGGGHVRQLLDLQPAWARYDHFFITEDTALGQTLSASHRTYFVPHFAWGQAKLGAPVRMIGRAIASLFRSARTILRERPDVVITTGAGAVIFVVLWARLFGARIVVIESFARVERPSLFGRLAAPLAHDLIVQSAHLAATYPRAKVFDPLRMLDARAPPKSELLFATVGATLPFDRLVNAVAQLKAEGAIPERTIVQTGAGGVHPAGLDVCESLPFDELQALLRDASIVVCHGGTGSLITAVRQGCHVIAMPRLFALGEHYDDHQSEITAAFEKRGLIQVARSVDDLRTALIAARSRERVLATTDPQQLLDYLDQRLAELAARRNAAAPASA